MRSALSGLMVALALAVALPAATVPSDHPSVTSRDLAPPGMPQLVMNMVSPYLMPAAKQLFHVDARPAPSFTDYRGAFASTSTAEVVPTGFGESRAQGRDYFDLTIGKNPSNDSGGSLLTRPAPLYPLRA